MNVQLQNIRFSQMPIYVFSHIYDILHRYPQLSLQQDVKPYTSATSIR